MDHVRWMAQPTLHRPTIIAAFTGWNDAGDAASNSVRHLIEAWNAQPLAEMNQIIASKRNRARTDVLARVVRALERIEQAPEEFGLCRECEEPIGKRLEAMPYVEMCVDCQQERDGGPKTGRRRHITDYR